MAMEFCPHCMAQVPDGASACPACGGELSKENENHQLPVGTILYSQSGHSFLIGRTKGEGGFGITYAGRELSSGRVVAIKEFFPVRCQPQRQPDGSIRVLNRHAEENFAHGIKSFLSEASMLRAINKIPSVVQVLDFFEANGTAYMVMEYLNGATLQTIVEQQGPMRFDELMGPMLPLMQDLGKLHQAGVVHRDIAPDNVMRMPDGSFKLLDFGCARALEDGRSMTVLLKPGFAPLEQYTSRGQTASTDIYALCATIFYSITGRVPPAAPDRLVSIEGQPDPLPPPSALGAQLSHEQEQLLMWGLGLQPNTRPQKIEELLARLEELEKAQSAPGPQPIPEPETVGPVYDPAPQPVIDRDTEYEPVTGLEKVKAYIEDNKLLVGIVAGAIILLLLFAL